MQSQTEPLLALLLRRDQPARQRQLIMLGIVMMVLSCYRKWIRWAVARMVRRSLHVSTRASWAASGAAACPQT